MNTLYLRSALYPSRERTWRYKHNWPPVACATGGSCVRGRSACETPTFKSGPKRRKTGRRGHVPAAKRSNKRGGNGSLQSWGGKVVIRPASNKRCFVDAMFLRENRPQCARSTRFLNGKCCINWTWIAPHRFGDYAAASFVDETRNGYAPQHEDLSTNRRVRQLCRGC